MSAYITRALGLLFLYELILGYEKSLLDAIGLVEGLLHSRIRDIQLRCRYPA
jgi:hypothetical protein